MLEREREKERERRVIVKYLILFSMNGMLYV